MAFSYLRLFSWPRTRLFQGWLCLLILPVILFASLSVLSAAEKAPPPKVIILNSYYPGFTWSDGEVAGVLQELRRDYPKIDPAIEYLDTKRFPSDEHLLKMKDFLLSKYRGHKFDLVIALDNPALAMVLAHRQEIFPGTPVVFAGINDFEPVMETGHKKVTGTAEILDIAGTLNTALALHPNATEIFVINDSTLTGRAVQKDIEELLPAFKGRVKFTFAPPATMAEIVERIKQLPNSAIVFVGSFNTDKAGQTFPSSEGTRLLSENAKVPVYILHKVQLGSGPVGGILLDGEEEGRRAGKIALQVLTGTDAASIPVDTKSTARPMFDFRQLSRFHIPISALPPASIIINQPDSFYEKHKSLVLGTIALLAGLIMVISALSMNIKKRKRAEESLENMVAQWRGTFDAIGDAVFLLDQKHQILRCNQAMSVLLGKPFQEIIGKTCCELIHNTSQPIAGCPVLRMQETRKRESMLMLIEDRWFEATVDPIMDAAGNLTGAVHVVADITERTRTEEALKEEAIRRRILVEQSRDGIVVLDQNGKVFESNQRYAEMLGYSSEEANQLYVWDWDVQWTREDLLKMIRLVDATGDHFETRHRRKDGSMIDVEISTNGVVLGGQKLVFCVCRDISQRKQDEKEIYHQREVLRGLATRLAEMEEIERQKLAGKLHDDVCQNLASIGIILAILKLRAQQEPLDQLLSKLSDAVDLVEQTGEITRNIMEDLRPTVLDHYGLMGGLRQMGKQFSQRTGIALEVQGEEPDSRLDPKVELALFRIAQEALNNVNKHARASHVAVTQEIDQDTLRLTISDDGTGFDQTLMPKPKVGRGWGLMTIKERAMAVGGTFRIESHPGQGTQVTVEVPHYIQMRH